MSASVFMSYSWKDLPMAMRIYADLVRCGITVWRDEFSAEFSKTYKIEIEKALQKCDGLMLLDSRNSRRSQYVQDECSWLSTEPEWRYGSKKIAVCLIDNLEKTRQEPELFTGHNLIKHFDFSGNALYDNDRAYFMGITALCRFWGATFVSRYPDSTGKDFEDELSKVTIKDVDRNILLNEYRLIQDRLACAFPNTHRRLDLFVQECDQLLVDCPSPRLQLAIELLKAGKFGEVKQVMVPYTTRYADDPRAWRVLGSALFELDDFGGALQAYEKTIALTEAIRDHKPLANGSTIRFDSGKNLDYLMVSKINRATSLLYAGEANKAIGAYEAVFQDNRFAGQVLPDHLMLLIRACDEHGRKPLQQQWIARGLARFPGNFELNLAHARLLFEMKSAVDAMRVYDYLVFREVKDMEIYGEYLSMLKYYGTHERFTQVFSKAVTIAPENGKDFYYLGYFCFLNGEQNKAEALYQESNYRELPGYEALWKAWRDACA